MFRERISGIEVERNEQGSSPNGAAVERVSRYEGFGGGKTKRRQPTERFP